MKIAYCGDVCNVCPRYVATLNGSQEELKKVALLLKKVNWTEEIISPEKVKCRGCQDVESCEYEVKECCIEKNVKNCGECNSYPCLTINKALATTESYKNGFKTILTIEEYKIFMEAFFSKKENLDKVKKSL